MITYQLNHNRDPLSFFQVLRVFNAALHFPCIRKLYFWNMYLQKGTK